MRRTAPPRPQLLDRAFGQSVVRTACSSIASMHVEIRELRARLSSYAERVRRGETLVVTRRGRVVALLRPIRPENPFRSIRAPAGSGRIVYKGQLRPEQLPPRIPLTGSGPTSTEYVRSGRR